MKTALSILAVILLSGCSTAEAIRQSTGSAPTMGASLIPTGDGNSSFSVSDSFDGFTLTVSYLHPVPNVVGQQVLNGCRQALDLAAVRAAQMRRRFINQIANQTITVRTSLSFDRPGQTLCTMTAPVRYSA